uniref:Uncharacterized protein n=1 Tax=Aegilops tauschii subsp. strangulata TaxID=200361 RepID=A0A453NT99_AEGTS
MLQDTIYFLLELLRCNLSSKLDVVQMGNLKFVSNS